MHFRLQVYYMKLSQIYLYNKHILLLIKKGKTSNTARIKIPKNIFNFQKIVRKV